MYNMDSKYTRVIDGQVGEQRQQNKTWCNEAGWSLVNSLMHLYKKDIEFEGPILCVPAVKGARAVVNVANRHRPHRHRSPLTMSATWAQQNSKESVKLSSSSWLSLPSSRSSPNFSLICKELRAGLQSFGLPFAQRVYENSVCTMLICQNLTGCFVVQTAMQITVVALDYIDSLDIGSTY